MHKMITTTTVYNPEISWPFSKDLLSRKMPKMKEDSETLWNFYQKIIMRLGKKVRNNAIRRDKLLLKCTEFLELYERAKTKEAAIERKTGKPAKGSFYYITSVDKKNERIFTRFSFSRKNDLFKCGSNHEI